jgi:hypothetical protein
MYKKKNKLTQIELKRQLHYDPETGIFTWKISKQRVQFGKIAGGFDRDGYIRININGKKYSAHRLAWLYMEGYWPEHQIDHKFGIKDDNRWSEIQHVTKFCNLQNQKVDKRNKSGFPGVTGNNITKKWRSLIRINNKKFHLGYYKDPLEAALARFTAEMDCPNWTCNHRGELAKAIKAAWPEFRFLKKG